VVLLSPFISDRAGKWNEMAGKSATILSEIREKMPGELQFEGEASAAKAYDDFAAKRPDQLRQPRLGMIARGMND
jgi:hypothetical protein